MNTKTLGAGLSVFLQRAEEYPPLPVAVVDAQEDHVLQGVLAAGKAGLMARWPLITLFPMTPQKPNTSTARWRARRISCSPRIWMPVIFSPKIWNIWRGRPLRVLSLAQRRRSCCPLAPIHPPPVLLRQPLRFLCTTCGRIIDTRTAQPTLIRPLKGAMPCHNNSH